MERILIVDDNKDMQFLLANILTSEKYDVAMAGDGNKALRQVKASRPDIVLLDIRLPGMDGMQVLEEIKRIERDILVIMLTAYGDIRGAVKAVKLGAYDYVTKPFDNDELLLIVRLALKTRLLNKELQRLQKGVGEKNEEDIVEELVGESAQIREVLEKVLAVASTDVTVVLEGESGTGKELIAQLIHCKSARCNKPFIAIDCGAIPETLVESELFGYEKGAFTGADVQKAGKFELSSGGTLFLDEITNLPDVAQAKLLRAVQEKKLQRLGGKKDTEIDVRIIAATNMGLAEAVTSGRFRSDLFYRLNEFPIRLPRLAERIEDIPFLAQRFLRVAAVEFNKDVREFSDEAKQFLLEYAWPGNVRELKNTVRRAALLCGSGVVAREHILPGPNGKAFGGKVKDDARSGNQYDPKQGRSLSEVAREASKKAERDTIVEALKKVNGNKTKAAKMLQIDRATLYKKIKECAIEAIEGTGL